MMTDCEKDIRLVLKELPNLTNQEICELLPQHNPLTVRKRIQIMEARNQLLVTPRPRPAGSKGRATLKTYDVNPTPGKKQPTKPLTNDAISELKAKVAELEAWKSQAIARYPDLAVDPAVLRARQLVAKRFTNGEAQAIMRGDWDAKPIMQVVLEAFEDA